jgi:hypothetical protein
VLGGERSEKGCGHENQICAQPKGGINERPDTMVRSVVWQRERWVANDPKEDAAKGNQICTGQQKGAENERPATSKPSLFCWREERVASDPRADAAKNNQICR